MKFTKVESSSIEGISHNAGNKVLTVKFHNRGNFRFTGVPASKATEFVNAESAGRFFNTEIRPNFKGIKA